MNLSSMKYIEMRKHQNNDFKRWQDFEDMGKIRCLCQNGSRHKNVHKERSMTKRISIKMSLVTKVKEKQVCVEF